MFLKPFGQSRMMSKAFDEDVQDVPSFNLPFLNRIVTNIISCWASTVPYLYINKSGSSTRIISKPVHTTIVTKLKSEFPARSLDGDYRHSSPYRIITILRLSLEWVHLSIHPFVREPARVSNIDWCRKWYGSSVPDTQQIIILKIHGPLLFKFGSVSPTSREGWQWQYNGQVLTAARLNGGGGWSWYPLIGQKKTRSRWEINQLEFIRRLAYCLIQQYQIQKWFTILFSSSYPWSACSVSKGV